MLLLTRPNHDRTTRYISAWAQKIIDLCSAKVIHLVQLDGPKAIKSIFESMLKRHTPKLVFLNGHGSPNAVLGQDNEVLVQGGVNEGVLAGAITYALSCSSAQELGAKVVQAGGRSYIGYTGDFIFMWSQDSRTQPLSDKTAELFIEPSNQVVTSLLKGSTTAEAVLHARRSFARNARKLLTSQADPTDAAALRYLVWDLQCLTLIGDTEAKIV